MYSCFTDSIALTVAGSLLNMLSSNDQFASNAYSEKGHFKRVRCLAHSTIMKKPQGEVIFLCSQSAFVFLRGLVTPSNTSVEETSNVRRE